MDIKHIKDELKRKNEYIAAKVVVSRYNSISKNYKEAVAQFKEAKEKLEKCQNIKNKLSEKKLSHQKRKEINEKIQSNYNNYNNKYQTAKKKVIDLKAKLDSLNREYEKASAVIEENKTLQKKIDILSDLDKYIKKNYVPKDTICYDNQVSGAAAGVALINGGLSTSPMAKMVVGGILSNYNKPDENIGDFIKNNLEEDFFELLSSYMDRCIKNKIYKSEVDIYKKAGCSRQQFHKMKNDPSYKPNKHTVLSYSVVCHLNHDETLKLLSTTGYTLSNSSKYDLIVNYYIKNGIYDFEFINECLYQYGYEKESELFLGSS